MFEINADRHGDDDAEETSVPVIRQFINSAIYVEKPVSASISSESCTLSQKYSSHEDFTEFQNVKIKKCTCSLNQSTCSFHKNKINSDHQILAHVPVIMREARNKPVSATPSQVKTAKIQQAKVKSTINMERDATIQNWLQKKEEEKRKKELQIKKIKEAKEKERQALLEQERNNFKMWLQNKKKAESEAKRKKEQTEEDKRLKDLEKEKRQLECHLNFQLWLKRKEEIDLEKKIKQQISLITEIEMRQRQAHENQKAFNDWLKNAKDKQKPAPMNKGLRSLSSSTSITYVNPKAWNPAP